jgi:hypothetical protein
LLEAQSGPLEYRAKQRWNRKIAPICRRIAERFPAYSVPILLSDTETMRDTPYLDRQPLRKDLRHSYDLEACRAMDHLFELFSAGVLAKIRRCERRACRLYFCGRTSKRFCSRVCFRKNMRQTPEYKKKNAEHQRNHYNKYFAKRKVAAYRRDNN